MTTTADELVGANVEWARGLAREAARKTKGLFRPEDLEGAAFLGLVKAAQRYDGSIPFQLYAQARVRGSILDELRNLNWLPRADRRNGARGGIMLRFSEVGETGEVEGLEDETRERREREDEAREAWGMLSWFLTENEARVLFLHYGKGLSLREVAEELGWSKTWTCEVRNQALRKVRGEEAEGGRQDANRMGGRYLGRGNGV